MDGDGVGLVANEWISLEQTHVCGRPCRMVGLLQSSEPLRSGHVYIRVPPARLHQGIFGLFPVTGP